MSQVIAHAPSKINLSLEVKPLVIGEEKHQLDSIFCTTALCDTLVFDFIRGPEPFHAEVTTKSTDFDTSFLKERDNILIKTVEQFKRSFGFGFLPAGILKVELIKSIPTQAGLGGGSSNAAAMLRMLCWLAQIEPLSDKSLEVAQAVGADVPFFLHSPKEGLCARMGGYGDVIEEILPKPLMPIVLVKPEEGVSTRRAFAAFDRIESKENEFGVTERLATALKEREGLKTLAALCTNNLEPIAKEFLPAIGTIKEELVAMPGVVGVAMTGSGSAVFALCETPQVAQTCMQHYADRGFWTVATQT